MNGFSRRDVRGTEKIWGQLRILDHQLPRAMPEEGTDTHVREQLLQQLPLLLSLPLAVEHTDTPTSLQTVTGHLELVHRMNVLNVTLDAGSVGRTRSPHVQVLVTASLEVEGVRARVKVRELVQEVERRLGVKLGVCC